MADEPTDEKIGALSDEKNALDEEIKQLESQISDEVKPEEPVAEVKPEEPVAELKPEEPVAEVKPEEPAAAVDIKSLDDEIKTLESQVAENEMPELGEPVSSTVSGLSISTATTEQVTEPGVPSLGISIVPPKDPEPEGQPTDLSRGRSRSSSKLKERKGSRSPSVGKGTHARTLSVLEKKKTRRASMTTKQIQMMLNPEQHKKRRYLVIINMIFMILGIGIIILGMVIQNYYKIIPEAFIDYVLFSGLGLCIFSIIGCYGAYHRKKFYLFTFAFFILALVIVEAGFTVVYLAGIDVAQYYIELGWSEIEDKPKEDLEMAFECCGLKNITAEGRLTAPCLSEIYADESCIHKFVKDFTNNIEVGTVVVSLIVILELSTLYLAFSLACSKHQKMDEDWADEVVVIRKSTIQMNKAKGADDLDVIEEINWAKLYTIGESLSKEKKDLLMYQLACNRLVWKCNVDKDYWLYVKDRHPMLNVWLHHPMHPFAHWKRILLLLSSFLISFSLTNGLMLKGWELLNCTDAQALARTCDTRPLENNILRSFIGMAIPVMILMFWCTAMRIMGSCACVKVPQASLGLCSRFMRWLIVGIGNIMCIGMFLIAVGVTVISIIYINTGGRTDDKSYFEIFGAFFQNLGFMWILWFVFPGWLMFYIKWSRELRKNAAERRKLGLVPLGTKIKKVDKDEEVLFEDMKVEVMGEEKGKEKQKVTLGMKSHKGVIMDEITEGLAIGGAIGAAAGSAIASVGRVFQ